MNSMPHAHRRGPLWSILGGSLLAVASTFAQGLTPSLPNNLPSGLVVEDELPSALVPEEDFTESRPSAAGDALTRSFTNDGLQQPRAVGAPRDPLAARRKTQSKVGISVRAGVEYNDNIFASSDDAEDDIVAVLSPTLSVNAGDYRGREATYLSAAYTATASTFIKNTADDTLDHLLEVGGQWKRKRVTIPFELRASQETGAFRDLGGRDTAQSYGGRIGLEYAASSKLSFGLSGEYSATDYDLFADFESAVAEAFVGYNVTSGLTVSGVYRYSDSKAQGADSQSYQAALLRVNAQPSSKVTAFAELGLAFSSLSKGDRSDVIYRAGVAIQPNSRQRIAFEAVRQPSTSSFTVGSGFINNGFQVTYEQALGARARVVLTGGYELQDYFAADEGATTDRQDDYFAFSSLLAYDLNDHWQAQLYYTYSNNDSNTPQVAFDNQRVGMGLSWSY